ncbi:hemin transport protein HmuS [Klebsiella variicola]|uniref:Hemin transport protein HmuS n=1 Tax=Klebsiella variicola TaxID=244366 RepID=A0A7H4MR55_KLEVA|nr:hemin transport protein HmuS [Klebsiella variicola]
MKLYDFRRQSRLRADLHRRPGKAGPPCAAGLNIFNTTFTLHLREESLDEVWVTRKTGPSDGHVHQRRTVRPKTAPRLPSSMASAAEGHPEQAQWRQQVDRLTREGLPRMMRWLLLFIAFPAAEPRRR